MEFNVSTCWAVTVSTALASLACYAVKGLGATILSARPSRAVAIAALASLAGHRVTAKQTQEELIMRFACDVQWTMNCTIFEVIKHMAARSTYKIDDDSLQNLDLYIMNTVTMLSLEADRQASTYKQGCRISHLKPLLFSSNQEFLLHLYTRNTQFSMRTHDSARLK